MLKKQVNIYSVDTNSFLNKKENELMAKIKGLENNIKLLKEYTLLNLIKDISNKTITFDDDKVYKKDELIEDVQLSKFLIKIKNTNTEIKKYKRKADVKIFEQPKYKFDFIEDYILQLKENENRIYIRKYMNTLVKRNKPLLKDKAFKNLMIKIDENYIKFKDVEYKDKKDNIKTKKIDIGYKAQIKELKKEFNDLIKKNTETRRLNSVSKYSIISVFESDLTRTLGLKTNELSEDLITVGIYHYPIMKQLLKNGFAYNNEKYIYFSSSAGQIRNHKMVYIKETLWEQFQKTLMCGLTIEDINKSAQNGCNINKFLSYLALTASATDEWSTVIGRKFNIDECIVIDDFETTLTNKEVDYIAKTKETKDKIVLDSESKKIKNEDGTYKTIEEKYWLLADKAERKPMNITITHSDGCGWILPELSKKNFQCRLSWIKGLLTPNDFILWCNKYNNGNYKVTDIWGKEWDLKKDNIKIIFSRSQFKMWKYYSSWDDYKTKFNDNNCKANICNMEDDKFKKASFNYQMWQTLEDCDEKVINKFTNKIDKLIIKAYTDKNTMLELLGATNKNNDRNYLQESLVIYPELLQDYHIQKELSECISKIRKNSKYGKFKLDKAYYTFLIPDVFAWMQFVFWGKDKVTGLLKDKEVYCKLFSTKKYNELLVNRSPALYKEHCVRNNVTSEDMKDWFVTDGIYTSCHDMISKILQFDNDGDKSLVIGDSDIIEQASYNMKGIVPLYYEMGKAEAKEINAENIYNSLVSAFQYGNIGEYSNKLTKLWNHRRYDDEGNIIDFTEDEKKERLNIAKLLCCLNNFSIDAAKTLEMVEVSNNIKKKLSELEKYKLPYFFKFAKDKDASQVEAINNSTVNTICKKIENIKQGDFDFSCVGKFNKNRLMNNIHVDLKSDVAKEVIEKYKELKQNMEIYFMCVCNLSDVINNDEEVSKERIAYIVYTSLRQEFEDFCKTKEINIVECVDIIIKYIYKSNKDCKKGFLFNILGDIILDNLKNNIEIKQPKEGCIFCECCGKEVEKKSNRQTMCLECAEEKRKKKDRERKSKK